VVLNLPSSEAETWAVLVNKPASMFNAIIKNINYLTTLPMYIDKKIELNICVNSISKNDLSQENGYIDLLENIPGKDLNTHLFEKTKTIQKFKEMYPEATVFASRLVDRAGFLYQKNVFKNKQVGKTVLNANVIGCKFNRLNMVHINANGQVFICCNDYEMDTIYGDLNEASLAELWGSQSHKSMVQQSFNTLCTQCTDAIWG
jgi:hypothetical protein